MRQDNLVFWVGVGGILTCTLPQASPASYEANPLEPLATSNGVAMKGVKERTNEHMPTQRQNSLEEHADYRGSLSTIRREYSSRRSLVFSGWCDGFFGFTCTLWTVLKAILCSVFTRLPLLCEVPEPPTSSCPLYQGPINATSDCTSPAESALPVCLGIRGNGPRATAHFPATARVVEVLGPISAAAGASSGLWTMFILESIQNNPVVVDCPNDTCCGLEEQKARISFLLKSFEAMPSTYDLFDDITSIVESILSLDLLALLRSRSPKVVEDAFEQLLSILKSFSTKNEPIINPDATDFILNADKPIDAAIDVVGAAVGLLSFGGETEMDPKIFVRPGLINVRRLGEGIDRVASFYRGLYPVRLDEMRRILDDCALQSVGLRWRDIAALPTDGGMCGERLTDLFDDFQLARGSNAPSRLDEFMGETGKLKTVSHVTTLTGKALTAWKTFKAAYEADPLVDIPFEVDFDDVRLGYFSTEDDMDIIEQGTAAYADLASQKFLRLPPLSWRDAFFLSTSEPGLARGIDIDTGIAVGGYNAMTPSAILAAWGCDKIVLINRSGGQDFFVEGLNRLLGASEATLADLSDLNDPDSSASLALRLQDAAICCPWDDFDLLDFSSVAQTGFDGNFYSADPCLLSLSAEIVNDEEFGCTEVTTE